MYPMISMNENLNEQVKYIKKREMLNGTIYNNGLKFSVSIHSFYMQNVFSNAQNITNIFYIMAVLYCNDL